MTNQNEVRTIIHNEFYTMMQMLNSLVNAEIISSELADLAVSYIVKECQEERIYLW